MVPDYLQAWFAVKSTETRFVGERLSQEEKHGHNLNRSPAAREVGTLGMKYSLEPIIDTRSRILILGSLPGDESLRLGRYYSNPRNEFWRILAMIYGDDIPDEYEDRVTFLLARGLALWDVLQAARREGSLDSAIRDETPHDFGAFFSKYPGIVAIAFNGTKAEQLFRRHVIRKQGVALPESLRTEVLPSTSATRGRYNSSTAESVGLSKHNVVPSSRALCFIDRSGFGDLRLLLGGVV